MTDHRRIQRVLFRMQLDRGFARRLAAGEACAAAQAGLDDADLRLLLATGLEGILADAGGRRRAQFLRNVASECPLTVAASRMAGDPGALEDFTESARFHECVSQGGRLPLAFAEHLQARAEAAGDVLYESLARLELALARLRRFDAPRRAPRAGELALAPRVDVLPLPAGTVDAAVELRRALDEGREPFVRLAGEGCEHVLVAASGASSPLRLRDVGLEVLGSLAGAFLFAAREPLGAADLEAFRARHDVAADELASFVAPLQQEGLLILGSIAPSSGSSP